MAILGIFVTKWSIENLGSVLLALKPAQDIKQKKEAPRGETPLVGFFSGGDQSSANTLSGAITGPRLVTLLFIRSMVVLLEVSEVWLLPEPTSLITGAVASSNAVSSFSTMYGDCCNRHSRITYGSDIFVGSGLTVFIKAESTSNEKPRRSICVQPGR